MTYVRIGDAVRPRETVAEVALSASTVAETYCELIERDQAATRVLDLYCR